jgi:hypothetical protein
MIMQPPFVTKEMVERAVASPLHRVERRPAGREASRNLPERHQEGPPQQMEDAHQAADGACLNDLTAMAVACY